MQFDFAAKELTIKLVYYGPALSGKTTNLQSLHLMADSGSRGRLDDPGDQGRSNPLFRHAAPDVPLRKGARNPDQAFTVPGQVIHGSTRRLVLQGADGVAFIADSQLAETENNAAAFMDLRENLKANGMKVGQMPLVIQFNKRDMPDVRSDAELVDLARVVVSRSSRGRHRRQGRARNLHGSLAPDLQLARCGAQAQGEIRPRGRCASRRRGESSSVPRSPRIGFFVRAWVGHSMCSQPTRVARDRRRRLGADRSSPQGLSLGGDIRLPDLADRDGLRELVKSSTLSSGSRFASSPQINRSSRSR